MSASSAAQVQTIGGAGLFERSFPYIGLGSFAARNIIYGNDGLRKFTPVSRGVLAGLVFGIICLRKGLPNWIGSHGHQLRIVLQRLIPLLNKTGAGR